MGEKFNTDEEQQDKEVKESGLHYNEERRLPYVGLDPLLNSDIRIPGYDGHSCYTYIPYCMVGDISSTPHSSVWD